MRTVREVHEEKEVKIEPIDHEKFHNMSWPSQEKEVKRLVKLYKSEINWKIETFWDSGYTATLGDDLNGYTHEREFQCLEDAIGHLWRSAKERYPNADVFKQEQLAENSP